MQHSSLVQQERGAQQCVSVSMQAAALPRSVVGRCSALGWRDLHAQRIAAGKGLWATCAAWQPPGHAWCPADGCKFIAPLQKMRSPQAGL